MKKKCHGFTLMELLIASALFIVVMAGVYSSFRTGVFGYRHMDKQIEFSQGKGLAFWRINGDLRNLFSFSDNESKFNGGENALSFLTEVDFYQDKQMRQDVAFVSYSLAQDKLMRLCLRGKDSLTHPDTVNPQEMAVGVKDLQFSFAAISSSNGSLLWNESWNNNQTLPYAVKIKMVFNDSAKAPLQQIIYLAQ